MEVLTEEKQQMIYRLLNSNDIENINLAASLIPLFEKPKHFIIVDSPSIYGY